MKSNKTNLHHYKFNDHFDEVNTELLGCIESLSPIDSFHEFDQLKVMKLSEFYPEDFSHVERVSLEHQLGDFGDLARVMVETNKHLSHPLVYRLLKLVLTLHVATAINRISDQFLNDYIVCFVEKELLEKVTNEVVMKRFQNMELHKITL
ncbi:hypothetical protein EUTSA_v10023825mg [Eutrema salsugineum]|uniref:Uncharacterized protein n=1 Tax=Eutrema salsugineum TaxID=72664 RepID=V4JW83_EUTSA|nr:hypothetical protein EUTSA_v10023825mg [Eutrema salsugineum]